MPGREPGVPGRALGVLGLEPDTPGREPGAPGREPGLLGRDLGVAGGETDEPRRGLGLGLGTSLGPGTVLEPIVDAPGRIVVPGPLRTSAANPSTSVSVMERRGFFPHLQELEFYQRAR